MIGGQRLRVIADLASVRVVRPERILGLSPVAAVVLVGGTCAGKSTLARALAADLIDLVEVVPRASTRLPRQGDTQDRTQSVSDDLFETMLDQDRFVLAWARPMQGAAPIRYGCLRSKDATKVPVLMAGHGVYSNAASVRPQGALNGALLVGVHSSPEQRLARLFERSPDVVARGEEEVARLLAHDDEAMALNVDLVVENTGEGRLEEGSHRPAAIDQAVEAIRALLAP